MLNVWKLNVLARDLPSELNEPGVEASLVDVSHSADPVDSPREMVEQARNDDGHTASCVLYSRAGVTECTDDPLWCGPGDVPGAAAGDRLSRMAAMA